MNSERNGGWVVRIGLVAFCTLAGVLLLVPQGQKAQVRAQNHVRISMTTDWSNRHMVYGAPASIAQALRLQNEPRYLHQLARRNAVAPPQ